MSRDDESGKPSLGTRLWQGPRPWWLIGLPLGGVLMLGVGAVAALGFLGFVEYSSTEHFCLSCHEMRDNAYAEYTQSPHYSNRSGVRAVCADCHVPGPWGPKMVRKIQATLKEVPNHFLGKLDTPEKYAAHRAAMAETVWTAMRKTDSRECRACHEQERMDPAKQSRQAARKHSAQWREANGETCIDCHQGIAHHLPEMP